MVKSFFRPKLTLAASIEKILRYSTIAPEKAVFRPGCNLGGFIDCGTKAPENENNMAIRAYFETSPGPGAKVRPGID